MNTLTINSGSENKSCFFLFSFTLIQTRKQYVVYIDKCYPLESTNTLYYGCITTGTDDYLHISAVTDSYEKQIISSSLANFLKEFKDDNIQILIANIEFAIEDSINVFSVDFRKYPDFFNSFDMGIKRIEENIYKSLNFKNDEEFVKKYNNQRLIIIIGLLAIIIFIGYLIYFVNFRKANLEESKDSTAHMLICTNRFKNMTYGVEETVLRYQYDENYVFKSGESITKITYNSEKNYLEGKKDREGSNKRIFFDDENMIKKITIIGTNNEYQNQKSNMMAKGFICDGDEASDVTVSSETIIDIGKSPNIKDNLFTLNIDEFFIDSYGITLNGLISSNRANDYKSGTMQITFYDDNLNVLVIKKTDWKLIKGEYVLEYYASLDDDIHFDDIAYYNIDIL